MWRGERLMRAATAAVASTSLALGFHLAAGATMPRAQGVLVPLLAAFAVSLQLSGKAMSRWRLALAVALSQAAFHVSFGLGLTSGQAPNGDQIGHVHDHAHAPEGVTAAVSHAGHGQGMIASHILAAVATYVVLRRSDVLLAWATRLVRALIDRLRVPSIRVAIAKAGHGPLVAAPGRVRRIVASPHGLRGPPFSLA